MCAECAADPGRFSGDCEPAIALALRVIFALTLDREAASHCLEGKAEKAVALWPSRLYGLLASAAVRSPVVFCRCAQRVDHAFDSAGVDDFAGVKPVQLVQHFVDGREVLSPIELGSMLWSLLRQAPTLGFVIARLAAEVEVAATRRAHLPLSASFGARRATCVRTTARLHAPAGRGHDHLRSETRSMSRPENTR